MAVTSILEKPEATSLSPDDILYLIKGSGSNRDKKVKLSTLRAWLQTLSDLFVDGTITISGTGGSAEITNGGISFNGTGVNVELSAQGLKINGVTLKQAMASGVAIAQITHTLECLVNLIVDGTATFNGSVKAKNGIDLDGPTLTKILESQTAGIAVSHFLKCLSNLVVVGSSTFEGGANMTGGGSHSGTHSFNGNVNFNSGLNSSGDAVFNGKTKIKGGLVLKDGIPGTMSADTPIFGTVGNVDLNNNSLSWSAGQEVTVYNDSTAAIAVVYSLNKYVTIPSKCCGKFVCISVTSGNNTFAPVIINIPSL